MVQPERIPVPWRRRVRVFATRRVPFIVWLALAVLAWLLLDGRINRTDALAIATARQVEVAPLAAGRVTQVAVDLYQRVAAGEIVAAMDDEALVAEIATVDAELARLQAQFVAERARLQSEATGRERERVAEARRFAWNAESAELERLDQELRRELDRVELQRVELQLARLTKLVEQGHRQRAELEDLALSRDATAKRIDNATRAIEAATKRRDAAEARSREIAKLAAIEDPAPLLDPFRRAIDVQQARVGELAVQRRSRLLRAPIDGVVGVIVRRPGESVVAGSPVLRIDEMIATRAVAYLPQRSGPLVVVPGTNVELRRQHSVSRPLRARVLRVGATVEALPVQARSNPDAIEYGRPVLIDAEGLDLLPGETLYVRFAAEDLAKEM